MGEACTIVLFGATGDLAKKKLIPSLYQLHMKKKLHKDTAIIAIGRKEYTDAMIRKQLGAHCGSGYYQFSKRITYHRLEFHDEAAYIQLKDRLDRLPKHIRSKRLFYLATPQTAFRLIVQHLSSHRIAESRPKRGWHRVIFEKPFGSDLETSRQLNDTITQLFTEEQIYRIDHYVAKTLVQEILVLRYSNPVFESVWSSEYITRVQIEVVENEGVGTRGEYYDSSGALRDMVQNHMLQLLSLVTMEDPVSLEAEAIRDEKSWVLKDVKLSGDEDALIIGQYEGYTKEEGVRKDSKTETFASVKLNIDNKRWAGTPFYLLTGKAMDARYADIIIEFSAKECPLFKDAHKMCGLNTLVIRIQPHEGVCFIFNLADDESKTIKPHIMEYSHKAAHMNTPEAYEILLKEAIRGDRTLFTRWDFVEQSWKIVDALREKVGRLHTYRKGSRGPKPAVKILDRAHKEL